MELYISTVLILEIIFSRYAHICHICQFASEDSVDQHSKICHIFQYVSEDPIYPHSNICHICQCVSEDPVYPHSKICHICQYVLEDPVYPHSNPCQTRYTRRTYKGAVLTRATKPRHGIHGVHIRELCSPEPPSQDTGHPAVKAELVSPTSLVRSNAWRGLICFTSVLEAGDIAWDTGSVASLTLQSDRRVTGVGHWCGSLVWVTV